MKISRRISECEPIPPFYGVAYRDVALDKYIVAIIPFNFILGIMRKITLCLKNGLKENTSRGHYNEAWCKGYRQAFEDIEKFNQTRTT